ncbi:hypothetical protein AB870_10415 [Pandoraea faecigallinarum]|uniref:Conjugal transfer protein TraD n=2 Tax=Pandoraea TaxID=93217 RepID=A0A5E4UNY5_9BURK|nr:MULTISPECIES: hypothetical protein [Burkholderiaceae]AKM30431.1 hypothetical protein AB870_10415 [Pandoraea faecigallinarum]PRG17616.1 hypothetical protein C6Q35_29235 [Burkholderia multivorans]PRG81327.1 hypothetical protein C6T69_00280 [Burkholderia multivorans]VVE01244.1 conjugal transfer protein TraD [Pandoraea nosoerga]
MTMSSDEKQSNLNATTQPSDKAGNATGAFKENALSEQDAIASGNVLANLADAPEPTFLDDEGPTLDVPLFITRNNARELFGLCPGETVAQALARKAKEG